MKGANSNCRTIFVYFRTWKILHTLVTELFFEDDKGLILEKRNNHPERWRRNDWLILKFFSVDEPTRAPRTQTEVKDISKSDVELRGTDDNLTGMIK